MDGQSEAGSPVSGENEIWPRADGSQLIEREQGGTAITTRGRMTGRIIKRGADEMGRYTWIMLNGKNGKQVTVISAYRACK